MKCLEKFKIHIRVYSALIILFILNKKLNITLDCKVNSGKTLKKYIFIYFANIEYIFYSIRLENSPQYDRNMKIEQSTSFIKKHGPKREVLIELPVPVKAFTENKTKKCKRSLHRRFTHGKLLCI